MSDRLSLWLKKHDDVIFIVRLLLVLASVAFVMGLGLALALRLVL